jgi:CheY-like chemotaxis protein
VRAWHEYWREEDVPGREKSGIRERFTAPTGAGDSLMLEIKGVILLVDDSATVVPPVKELLQAMGYSVIVARNGREAIEICRGDGSCIDLVILDLNMPGMSGEETCRQLKQMKKEMRIILSSGYTRDLAWKSLQLCCDGYLEKPFSLATLTQTLRGAMDNPSPSPH